MSDDADTCTRCNGCGEHDAGGGKCTVCRGRGVFPLEIKPCPHCGETDEDQLTWEAKPVRDAAGGSIYYVGCDTCSTYSLARSKEEGVRLWNARAIVSRERDGSAAEVKMLVDAGLDEYAAICALRTEDDGGFCHAYLYSDGQWRFQTGGRDLLAANSVVKCLLTKRLYVHPAPLEQGMPK